MLLVILGGLAAAAHANAAHEQEQRAHGESDDTSSSFDNPNFYAFNQVPPPSRRQNGARNRLITAPVNAPHVPPRGAPGRNVPAVRTLRAHTQETPEELEAIAKLRGQFDHDSVPFTGYNNSSNNYNLRWVRTMPLRRQGGYTPVDVPDPRYFTGSEFGTDHPDLRSLIGPGHEPRWFENKGYVDPAGGGRKMLAPGVPEHEPRNPSKF